MELQKVFQEVNRKLAYNTQHLSKKSLNGFGSFFVLVLVCSLRGVCVLLLVWGEGCCFGFLIRLRFSLCMDKYQHFKFSSCTFCVAKTP